jgi:hypothetical protein
MRKLEGVPIVPLLQDASHCWSVFVCKGVIAFIFYLKYHVCFVIFFSARNGRFTVIAGIDDIIKDNGHDALHLLPYRPNLKPIKFVLGRHQD